MVIEENLRPENELVDQPQLWFVVVPDSIRISVIEFGSKLALWSSERGPFVATRALTTLVFGLIVLALVRIVYLAPDRLLECAFLTIAWFWLLSPTQNPWYWTWAMPLLPFARSRVWLFVGGLTMMYYLRFWAEYHVPTVSLFGESYSGNAVFDFLVVWVEFSPIFILLVVSVLRRSSGIGVGDRTSDNRGLEPTIVPAEQ